MSKWCLQRDSLIKKAHVGFRIWLPCFWEEWGPWALPPAARRAARLVAVAPGCRWTQYWTTFTVQKAWHSLLPVGGKANWEVCIKAVMSSIYMYWLEVGPPFLIYHHQQLWNFPHVDWHGSYSRSSSSLLLFFPLPLLNQSADPPAGMAW